MTEAEIMELLRRRGLRGWDDGLGTWGMPWDTGFGSYEGGGGPFEAGGFPASSPATSLGLGAAAPGGYADGAGGFYSANLARLFEPSEGGAGAGANSVSDPGIGMNATSTNLGDFLGSLAMPIGAGVSIAGQAIINDIRGTPGRQITSAGLGGLWDSITGGVSSVPGPGPGGDTQISPPEAELGGSGGSTGAGMADVGGTESGANPEGFEAGGPVTLSRLIGGDPPGPDDGFGALDAGEHVLRKRTVQKLGGQQAATMLAGMIDAGKVTLADIMRSKGS